MPSQGTIAIMLILLFYVPAWAGETTSKSLQLNFISLRMSLMNVHQGNGGDLSTGSLEVGYRHWFNTKIYSSFSVGAYPLSSDSIDSTVGTNLLCGVGFNLDNVIRIEYGVAYYTWGESMASTTNFVTKVIIPTRQWPVSELFGSMGFPGNSSGKTPLYILNIGIGKLF